MQSQGWKLNEPEKYGLGVIWAGLVMYLRSIFLFIVSTSWKVKNSGLL